MSQGERLSRGELTWLLTQEARGAASKLRQGVEILSKPESLPPPAGDSLGIESSLDALDNAVAMLSTLHGGASPRPRRGRIDLVTLLWDIAPNARAQIEMGEGTCVHGDEAELRRMMHVLLSQSGDPDAATASSEIHVRRDGEEIRLTVNLGPDKSATFETEQTWLTRMAARYGGRLELLGSTQTLVLPADVDPHKQEVEELRKELAEAHAQGEAYARELAAVVSGGHTAEPPSVSSPAAQTAAMFERIRHMSREVHDLVVAIGNDATAMRQGRGNTTQMAAAITRRVTAASAILVDLMQAGPEGTDGTG